MASQFDLAPRIEALQAAGLVIATDYQGRPAKWLTSALTDVDFCVLNCKGVGTNDTVVLVKLATLEQLVLAAGDLAG
jgi:hypothetical protein